MPAPRSSTRSRPGRAPRAARAAAATAAAILALSVVAVACGGGGDDVASGRGAPSAPQGAPSTAPVDRNDLLAECLAQRDLDVRRAGVVDGEMNAGVDLSHIDQSNPDAHAAVEECIALADAAAAGDQADPEMPSEGARLASFEAYMEELTDCMVHHGFHPSVVDLPGDVTSGAAAVEYPPGEEGAPGFLDARAECTDAAQDAEERARTLIDG
jgi:hypothetical protein